MSSTRPPRRLRRSLAATAAGVLGLGALGVAATPTSAAPASDQPAPVVGAQRASVIDGRYIVVLDGAATNADEKAAAQEARAAGARDIDRYAAVLDGFSGRFSEQALQQIRRNPDVSYVEADQRVTASATQSPATWGLDRIDQRSRPLTNSYTYDRTGAGVTAYIIDTGINAAHTEFGGRVTPGATAINDGRGSSDCNGHGTHVAGTVGGATYGVAKQVTLVPVRVLDCSGSGSTSGVIAGVDWVTSNHTSGPAVANMSLGGGASTTLDNAVSRSISDGVSYSVAAGNENTNACYGSPARVGSALTVGSTTSTDARSSFSNYGSCVDLFAPGSSITSAWWTSNTATNTISGTSMATPHVAGAAALYLQGHPTASPATVASAITGNATTGVVSGAGTGSPNRLLYSRIS